MTVYAVIETGGKQYKVSHNDIIKIEKIPGEVGEIVEFKTIHLLNTGEDLKFEESDLSQVSVKGKIIAQEKDKKIIVFKFKRRKNYKRKKGHRQQITRVLIKEIYFGKDLLTPKDEKKKAPAKEKPEPEAKSLQVAAEPKPSAEEKPQAKKKAAKKVEKKAVTPKKAEKEEPKVPSKKDAKAESSKKETKKGDTESAEGKKKTSTKPQKRKKADEEKEKKEEEE